MTAVVTRKRRAKAPKEVLRWLRKTWVKARTRLFVEKTAAEADWYLRQEWVRVDELRLPRSRPRNVEALARRLANGEEGPWTVSITPDREVVPARACWQRTATSDASHVPVNVEKRWRWDETRREMAALGRQGGLKGGNACAAKLSKEQRSEIARRGGLAKGRS
jgi:hypothetical protein